MTPMAGALDNTDAAIVECLRQDARLSFRELGERVNLSSNAARDRVRSLLARGVITGFHAHVDPGRIDKRLHAFLDVRLRSPDHAAQFERLVRAHPGVVETVHLTGPADYLLRAACDDPTQLDELITEMKENGGVRDTQTRLILRVV
ncbi:Lrp/AsnC family transcriptional regulator, leucine-responsive regulatory protein [Marmoricola sp. URHA0025 HA25]